MSSETHRLVVDRFEGDLVVVEVDGERFLDLPRWLLPPGVREDDVIVVRRTTGENRVTLELEVDPAATAAARAEARRLIDELRRKDPGGDLSL
ncbi:MAG TPA: DUF3006 domain-containing protein [Longimicrobiales bacterium]|mgnify:CR=1 FL=1